LAARPTLHYDNGSMPPLGHDSGLTWKCVDDAKYDLLELTRRSDRAHLAQAERWRLEK
jgi:hypothetical protein